MTHRSEGPDPAPHVSRDASRSGADARKAGLILVVDDEPMVVRAVSQILTRAGYHIVTADGPVNATAKFDEYGEAIRLLLTDVVMPDGGGRRLADELTERSPDLRVLFMSGFTEHVSVRDERALPAPLLSKPFTASKLETAVRDALDASQACG
ncbi:MAG TPA: response regulator [Gemmatimonadaceae bacterium]|nr:response regulator [Gemmatimonadaceae bacterium]